MKLLSWLLSSKFSSAPPSRVTFLFAFNAAPTAVLTVRVERAAWGAKTEAGKGPHNQAKKEHA